MKVKIRLGEGQKRLFCPMCWRVNHVAQNTGTRDLDLDYLIKGFAMWSSHPLNPTQWLRCPSITELRGKPE